MTAFKNTLAQLADLASAIRHGKSEDVPVSGRFADVSGAPPPIKDVSELRQRLGEWMARGSHAGWILTVDELIVLDGGSLPDSAGIPLHAELHRSGDNEVSLNLRHTPQGWIWEELEVNPENDSFDAFIEEKTVLIEPCHANGEENRLARYEVEWRLDASASCPATFRPARSRFVGWSNTRN